MITFLSPAIIIQLHDAALNHAKGIPGLREPGLVDALCQRVINLHQYEAENDVFRLAAMYLTAISRGHVFADANKRTALGATLLFLYENGILLHNTPALTVMTVEAAQGNLSLNDIATILRSHAPSSDV
ncbi:type II toxin-antitoxin system death-on-curing family toxin [Salmonella enterica]|nr:type II toxin-antitoxin system death-on-curing family toxin [Salmonella enterica]